MKKVTLLMLLIPLLSVFAQEKKITKNGIVNFEASVPSFEPVEAKHNSVSAVLNTSSGEIASLALVKGFRFKIALMEEHFNENYAESTKYPKAIFKGTIQNFNVNKLTVNPQKFIIKGSLEFHEKLKKFLLQLIFQKMEIKLRLKAILN